MRCLMWYGIGLLVLTVGTTAWASPIPSDDGDLELGEEVYARACLECHGDEGHGDGKTARELKFKARDFTLGAFKCRCTPSGELPSDDDLFRVVTNGIPGTPMRRFEDTLLPEERRAVIAYIKSLSPRFASESAAPCMSLPAPIPATPKLTHEGAQVYRVLRCWTCHGVDGKGRGPAARGLKDDWGKRISVYDFTRADQFKCGGSEQDLYRLLHTGMTGSPMPSFGEAMLYPRESAERRRAFDKVLDSESVDEIMSYIATEPDNAALRAMTAAEKNALTERRSWALVHYLRSLAAE